MLKRTAWQLVPNTTGTVTVTGWREGGKKGETTSRGRDTEQTHTPKDVDSLILPCVALIRRQILSLPLR